MKLVTEYPLWFIIFCLVAGLMYTAILYYRERRNEFTRWETYTMAAARFITISLLSFLLLSPLLETIFRSYEDPVIIIAHDNSSSVIIGDDSVFYMKEFQEAMRDLTADLSKQYQVREYVFGEEVRELGNSPLYSDRFTNISSIFEELEARYTNRNVGAVILASDGIYNRGRNPLYAARRMSFPLYTIAMGDTTTKRDIIVKSVIYNRIVYLGNSFPLEINLQASKCGGEICTLKVYKGKQLVYSESVIINEDHFFKSINVQLEAKITGKQRYRIVAATLENEISIDNNFKDIFIDVLDSRNKILILANSPHPDVSAIRSAIESNYNYETEVFMVNDFAGNITGYDLIIFHQLPSPVNRIDAILAAVDKAAVSSLFVIGGQSSLPLFNRVQTGVVITPDNKRPNDALPAFSEDFLLFRLSESSKERLRTFPPLSSPFGNYKVLPSATTFIYQKIGTVTTEDPLIFFNTSLNRKVGVISGEGIWRWKLAGFEKDNDHIAFNEIINKIVQYLSVRTDKSPFRITSRFRFDENESIEFNAELYNESFEAINEPDVGMSIVDDAGDEFPFVFSRRGDVYYLNAGSFPPGNYTYRAKVDMKGMQYSRSGEFIVERVNTESLQTTADHQLLYSLANEHRGKMIYPARINELASIVKARDDVKTIMYSKKRFSEIINLKWYLFLVLGLLTLEWFLRKRAGSY